MEVSEKSEIGNLKSEIGLAVRVDDAEAVYPVRIDPTFSDANWISMGALPGADFTVYATVVDGSGNLYIGGNFRLAGDVIANRIAKWNGSSWSLLGSGMSSDVQALAVSGGDLYAGGYFTLADGVAATNIAKWNGSTWSPLGSGMDGTVLELAVSGGDLYAGGYFTTAGGKVSPYLARAYLDLPTLSIVRSGGDMTVSWPTFYEGFALEQNPDAANPSSWSPANYPLSTNGATKSATVPLTPANQFFRQLRVWPGITVALRESDCSPLAPKPSFPSC